MPRTPSAPIVRAARPDEAAAVALALEWLFAPPGAVPPHWDRAGAARVVAGLLRSPRATVLVAQDAGGLTGVCTVYCDLRSVRFGDRAWVEDLVVHPGRRSAGLGAALLDAAKAWAREHGATHLELDSGLQRTDAHRFYRGQGAVTESASFGWRL